MSVHFFTNLRQKIFSGHLSFSFAQLLIAFSFLLGLTFVFIVPPFQKPDEPTHFYKAISVASGNFVCQKKSANVFQNPIPKYLADFPTQMFAMHIASGPNIVFPKNLYSTFLFKKSFDRSPTNEPSSCSLPFLLYLQLGLVLFLPVHFGANPMLIFYLGRLTNFLLTFGIFLLAVYVIPKKLKILPLFILSLPVVLYQLSSFSKDSLHLSCGILAWCLLISFFEKKKIHPREVVGFLLATAVAILARPQYALFAFLPLLIPYNKITKSRYLSQFTSLLFILFIASTIIFFLSLEIYSAKATSLGTIAPTAYVHPEIQLPFLKEYWPQIPNIINQTFERNSIFYFQSAVGILGWLEYGVPWYVYVFYFCFGVYVFEKVRKDLPKLLLWQFLLMNGIVFGTLLAILLSFYLYASPAGADSVSGIQGRYFLLLVPYLFWIFASSIQYLRGKIVGVFLTFIFIGVLLTIISRYYDTTHHFYRAEENLPIVNRNNSLFISQPLTQLLTVESDKKLRGVTFFAFQQKMTLSKPYEVDILDTTCNTPLRKMVIDPTTIKSDDWNDELFSPLKNVQAICVKIAPYHTTVAPTESLQLAQDINGKILLIPIYLN